MIIELPALTELLVEAECLRALAEPPPPFLGVIVEIEDNGMICTPAETGTVLEVT
jgi:hypothetical protein